MGKLSADELKHRAEGLLALGNSPTRVRQTLQTLGAAPAEIDAVMTAIEAQLRAKARADERWLLLLGSTAVATLLVLIAVVALLSAGAPAAPAATPQPGASPAPTRAGSTATGPAIAQTLLPAIPAGLLPVAIPTNIAPDFMLATPAVVQGEASGNERTACPRSASEAAEVFGGEAADWAKDEAHNGWTMTRVASGVDIDVPAGMVAGYLVITTGPEMRSVNGPATITNVNFIAISCS